MLEIVRLFVDICLFKKGPQDIPESRFLFWFSLILYSIVGMLILRLSVGWLDSLFQLIVGLILLLVFTYGLLLLKGKRSRFWPVVTALLGTDSLISFIALPVIGTLSAGRINVFSEILYLVLVIWSWLVMGHIFRHAISVSLVFGLGTAFLYIFSTVQVMGLLFPELMNITGE